MPPGTLVRQPLGAPFEDEETIDLTLDIASQYELLVNTIFALRACDDALHDRRRMDIIPQFSAKITDDDMLRFEIDVDPDLYPIHTKRNRVGWLQRLTVYKDSLRSSSIQEEMMQAGHLILHKKDRLRFEMNPCDDHLLHYQSGVPDAELVDLEEVFDIRLKLKVPITPKIALQMDNAICFASVAMVQAKPIKTIEQIHHALRYFVDPIRSRMMRAILKGEPLHVG